MDANKQPAGPVPPEGYWLLTDEERNQPLPKDAIFYDGFDGIWKDSSYREEMMSRRDFLDGTLYATRQPAAETLAQPSPIAGNHAVAEAATEIWAIQSPCGEVFPEDCGITPEIAWQRFCGPSLVRKAYEESGWKPVRLDAGPAPANTEPAQAELKPCPFCGGRPTIREHSGRDHSDEYYGYTEITCEQCRHFVGIHADDRPDAIHCWNTRPACPSCLEAPICSHCGRKHDYNDKDCAAAHSFRESALSAINKVQPLESYFRQNITEKGGQEG